MIECIFTIDYEIFGNGQGSLKELVYDPAEKLAAIFRKWNARFVVFAEVAELDMMEANAADPGINLVKQQLRHFSADGFELGLHIHPWWYNSRYEKGKWLLDRSEYNLCALPRHRIVEVVDRSINYLRYVLDSPDFTPFSFRAGHLLFEPSHTLVTVLAERGLKVDSSIYKGGLWHQHKLDYRPALKNGYFWRFTENVNFPDAQGVLLELPIYTRMIPTWKMFTFKRVGMQRDSSSAVQTGKKVHNRLKDFLRFRYPLKFDLGQMTMKELTRMTNAVILEDMRNPSTFRPIVAIGHTKDLIDSDKIESILAFLNDKGICVTQFADVYRRCKDQV
jgi:hypothetical protein